MTLLGNRYSIPGARDVEVCFGAIVGVATLIPTDDGWDVLPDVGLWYGWTELTREQQAKVLRDLVELVDHVAA